MQQGLVDIGADFEFQADVAQAVLAFALDLGEAIEAFKLLFLDLGNLSLDLLGAGAGPSGPDGNFRMETSGSAWDPIFPALIKLSLFLALLLMTVQSICQLVHHIRRTPND